MYCNNCGTQIDDGTKFCPGCGASQTGAAFQQPVINVINNNTNTNTNTNVGKGYHYQHKSKWVAFFLCLFLGYLGAHRFYVGKTGTGIIWLFTAGLFGVVWILDLILILLGSFRDNAGQRLI